MENISQLVESSLLRHGVTANFDHLRLQWTGWFRCESSFSVLLVPAKAGIFALGEEIIPPADSETTGRAGSETIPPQQSMGRRASPPVGPVDGQNHKSKRMLALFQVSAADDLGMALGRLFLPGTPLRDRLSSGKCFARYAVIEDPTQRQVATEVFQRWMQESSETASGISQQNYDRPCGADTPVRAAAVQPHAALQSDISDAVTTSSKIIEINKPSTSFAWGMEVQEREAKELNRPQPLPSGF